MLNCILSIIIFLIPVILCYFGYLYNKKGLKSINKKLEIEKETSKNLEYMYYSLLGKNINKK